MATLTHSEYICGGLKVGRGLDVGGVLDGGTCATRGVHRGRPMTEEEAGSQGRAREGRGSIRQGG